MSTVATVPPYLFHQEGTFDAPFEFDVPASLEVQPYTAHATFDGTGAAGQFRPCLTFYGVDGIVLGRYFPSTVVQPGDVAEVTYTPPFGTAAVEQGGGGVTEIDSGDGSLVVTNPTGPIVDLAVTTAREVLDTALTTIPANSQASFSFLHNSGATLMDLTVPTTPAFLHNGFYVVGVDIAWPTPAAGLTTYGRWALFNATSSITVADNVLPFGAGSSLSGGPVAQSVSYGAPFAAGTKIGVQFANDDASSKQLRATLTVSQVG